MPLSHHVVLLKKPDCCLHECEIMANFAVEQEQFIANQEQNPNFLLFNFYFIVKL